MAFGDGGNDTNMLKVAGIGVAMGNAGDSLKKVADYVTTTVDDDGIKRALEYFHVIEVFWFPFISSMGSNFKYLVSKTFPNVTN